ncbi:hypothetical protein G1O98_38540, partial [Nostoc sp. UIC10630]|nr:hypothetical protein [Nostoc sp. UIC 10630]
VLNFTRTILLNFSLHSYKFFRRLTYAIAIGVGSLPRMIAAALSA